MQHFRPVNPRWEDISHNVQSICGNLLDDLIKEPTMAATTTLTRTAPDISCEHCANAITGALGAIDGVTSVAVDIDEKRVNVEYNAAAASVEQIDAALEEEGYPPLR